MKSLTTETALDILIAWLQDNIDCESGIICKRKLTAVCSHQTRIGNLDAHLI